MKKNLRRKILDTMYCIALHSQHIPQWCVQAPAQAYMATDWLSHYNWETLTSSISCKNHAYWGTTLMKHSRSTSLYNCVIAPNPPQCNWLFILVFDENMLKNICAHAKTNANTHTKMRQWQYKAFVALFNNPLCTKILSRPTLLFYMHLQEPTHSPLRWHL